EEVRFSGFDSHARESAVAECVGCCRGRALRDREAAACWFRFFGWEMKFVFRVFLFALSLSAGRGFSLDREAFTFTNYDLTVRVEPEQQRLGVRGRITLRNDSQAPQQIAVLQITSSLDWRSIKAGDKPLQFVSQVYTTDIDHTGALSEA